MLQCKKARNFETANVANRATYFLAAATSPRGTAEFTPLSLSLSLYV